MKKLYLIICVLISANLFSQSFEIDTIVWNGPSDKRINLVILGDGYQANELSQFSENAITFKDALFKETPYKEYKDYFNVIAIQVPSNESGASHPGTATDVTEPAHPVKEVDNYFGSTFDAFNIHRLLVSTNSTAIFTVLATNFPSYDQVFMLINSPYYGGSGGQIATASLNSSSNEIAIHEMGHSFASLIDEYYAGDQYSREGINMTAETDPALVKWKNWMDFNGIGIYQHCCGGNSANWYRPHQNCKMRYLGVPFCNVCIEGTIERIHTLVNPIDQFEPDNTTTVDYVAANQFALDLIKPIPNTLEVSWLLNGEAIGDGMDTLMIDEEKWLEGDNQVQVSVLDTTAYLRIDNHAASHTSIINWVVNKSTSGIETVLTKSFHLDLFPNPTQDMLYWELDNIKSESYKVEIYDNNARLILQGIQNFKDAKGSLQIDHLDTGVYHIRFNLSNGIKIQQSFMKI